MSRSKFKGRECVIYLPSAEDLEIWKKEAKEYSTSLSKYIYEMAQRGRRTSKGISYRSDSSEDDRSKLIEESEHLKIKLHNTGLLLEKSQQEIKEMQSQADSNYYYVPALVDLFRNDNNLSNDRIISLLHLEPNDIKLRNLFKSLNTLNDLNLIFLGSRGEWKWNR